MRKPRVSDADQKVPATLTEKSIGRAANRVRRTPELEVALGSRIRAARIAARMSQGALAAAVGISFQQIQKYESGKDRVAASTLQGFAAALGVHPGSFYGDALSAPSGSIPDVKAAMRAAEVLQQIHDPHVLKQLLALGRVLAKSEAVVEPVAPSPVQAP